MSKMRPFLLLQVLVLVVCLYLPVSHGFLVIEAVVADSTDTDGPLISVGWQAAAQSLNTNSNAGIISSTVSFSSNGATLGKSIVDAVNAAGALMVFGLYDDDLTQAVMESTDFSDANLVLFGPYTQSTGVRTWNDNVYFMTADPMAEALALLNWVFSSSSGGVVQLGNVGFMHLTGGPFSDTTLSTYFTNQIALLGLRPPVEYVQSRTSGFNGITFNTYMEQNPSCMFLFGARGEHTTMFFSSLISSGQVVGSSFYIMMPFALMYSTSSTYQQQYLVNPTSVVSMGNLVYSAPFPLPNAGQRSASTQFQSDIKAYNKLSGGSLAMTSTYLMYYGWNFFQQINYIGSTYNLGGGLNYAGLKANVFMQNRYNIMDSFYGNYGGVCNNTATARRLGAACECNQGGHYVAVVKVSAVVAPTTTTSGVTVKLSSENYFPNYPCYTNQNVTATLTAFFGTVVSFKDNAAAAQIGSTMQTALSEATNRNKYGQTSPLTFTIAPVSTTSAATASASVTAQTAQTTMSVIIGPVSPPFLPGTMPDYFFVEPIEVPVNVERSPTSNALYLSATLRQQIYAVAQYLGSTSIPTQELTDATNRVHARLRTNNDTLCLDMIQRSLSFFNIHLGSGYGLGATVDFFAELPTSGHVFVIGLTPPDLPSLYQFLVNNPSVTIIIAFDELTVYYDTFSSLFGTTVTPVMSRVLFATNVPSWTQTGTGTIFQKFITNLPASARSPAAMRAFLAALAVDKISRGRNISSFALARELYQYNSFAIGGLPFGPFYDGCATYPPSAAVHCTVNFGARDISVWSYANIISPTTTLVAQPSSPPMLYGQKFVMLADTTTATSTTTATPSTSTTSTTTTSTTSTLPPCTLPPVTPLPPRPTSILPQSTHATHGGSNLHIGKYVIIGLLGLLVMLGTLVAAYLYWTFLPCFDGAPFVPAPCDPEAPTTIIFLELCQWLDVQRAVPTEAEVCLQKYRRVVRQLALKHRCYEVGSINDAFMMATRCPNDAVHFSQEVSRHVRSMRGPEVEVVQSIVADMVSEHGAAVATPGLHVRAGVHTDVVDIAYDVDSERYEYRGSGCVAALRTERFAHGGQVLVTGATCEALTEKQLAAVNAVSVGPHQYAEYEEPVQLFELVLPPNPEFRCARSPGSAAVRLNDPLLMMCGESSGEVEACIALAREVLAVAHETMPVKERIHVLRAKCVERGLRSPPRAKSLSLEAYATVLVDVLARQAVRMSCINFSRNSVSERGNGKRLSDDLSCPELELPHMRRSVDETAGTAEMYGSWEQPIMEGTVTSRLPQSNMLRE